MNNRNQTCKYNKSNFWISFGRLTPIEKPKKKQFLNGCQILLIDSVP